MTAFDVNRPRTVTAPFPGCDTGAKIHPNAAVHRRDAQQPVGNHLVASEPTAPVTATAGTDVPSTAPFAWLRPDRTGADRSPAATNAAGTSSAVGTAEVGTVGNAHSAAAATEPTPPPEPWWITASLRRWECLVTNFGPLADLVRAGFPINLLTDTPVFDQVVADRGGNPLL